MIRRTSRKEGLFETELRSALYSQCELYRYELYILWDPRLPILANVGLNPSTATESINDPTVTRDVMRARDCGFGALLKLNLFAYRSTDPKGMLDAEDPFGPDWPTADHILDCIARERAGMIVCTWGNHGNHRGRADEFRKAADRRELKLYCYQLNGATQEPTHPLYLQLSARPVPYLFAGVTA